MTTIPNLDRVNPAVSAALQGIAAVFSPTFWEVLPDGDGGARVKFGPVALNGVYAQSDTWLAAHITPQTPYADVYPVFVRPDLARRDGAALTPPVTPGHSFMGAPAVQISRRTNGMSGRGQAPAQKFQKVMAWLTQL